MSELFKTVCPLDCFDTCSFLVEVAKGRAVKIIADPDQPLTRGFACPKAKKQLERLYGPDRLLHPLRKGPRGWEKVSWDQAFDLMAEKLGDIKAKYGTTAVLQCQEGGSAGLLRGLENRFFNAYGGVTTTIGSLCWGAVTQAQKYDFGAYYSHTWDDLHNSRTIILWGRNPAHTNIHLLPYLKEAREKGAQVMLIDPVQTKTVAFCDRHYSLRPGTDGALALGLAYLILEERWLDLDFVAKHVFGFSEYVNLVKNYFPARVSHITGISEADLRDLASVYARNKPSAILLGYGMQRYVNSGQTVRAINALGAITGNIGRPGGGVSHAHQYNRALFNSLTGKEFAINNRTLRRPALAQDIIEAQAPPIKAIFVNGANPVAQLANTAKAVEAFKAVDFVVVADLVLTDTADLADLVLPVAGLFEKEDLVVSSWNQMISYSPKLVEPPGEAKADYDIFSQLARRMGYDRAFPEQPASVWLEEALKPAELQGVTLARLKAGPIANPLMPPVAWADKQFQTASGKFELFSQAAQKDGLNPLPEYVEPAESPVRTPEIHRQFPLHLITAHHQDYLHSQFYNLREDTGETNAPTLKLHPQTAENRYIRNNDQVIVESPRGQLRALAQLTSEVRPDTVVMYEGSWLKEGGGVNFLTADQPTDLGLGTPYNDCLCQVKKLLID